MDRAAGRGGRQASLGPLRGLLQQEQHRVWGRVGEQREGVLVNHVLRAHRQPQEAVTWREDGVVKEGMEKTRGSRWQCLGLTVSSAGDSKDLSFKH